MTQYVAVKFNAWDRRSYTYRHDGEPVSRVIERRTSAGGARA